MSTTHLSAAHSRPPTADARSPPPSFDEPDARHPPPRSFSQPQLPYHFQPPAAPGSAAPSLHHLTLPRHLTPALRDSFAPMCASARTSYTRVDATATVPGTPRAEAEQLQDLPVLAAAEGTAEGADNEKETDGAGDEVLPALPQAVLTFLLVSGRRRTMAFDPETTIGRMKELVWNAWPNEWQDERPPAPSYFRILYLGKILQDDDTVAKWSFPLSHPQPGASASAAPQNPTIVHLSIRAHAPAMEDTPKKRRGGGAGEEGEGAGCCGCVVC